MSAEVLPFAAAAGVTIQIGPGPDNRVFREGPASEILRDLLLAVASEVDAELKAQRNAQREAEDYGTRP